MAMVRRIPPLFLAVALLAAGTPLAATPCGTARSACAWMPAGESCPARAALTAAMACCLASSPVGTAPAPAGIGAPGAVGLPAAEVGDGVTPVTTPHLAADGALHRAERRRDIGLFLLVEVFRI